MLPVSCVCIVVIATWAAWAYSLQTLNVQTTVVRFDPCPLPMPAHGDIYSI